MGQRPHPRHGNGVKGQINVVDGDKGGVDLNNNVDFSGSVSETIFREHFQLCVLVGLVGDMVIGDVVCPVFHNFRM